MRTVASVAWRYSRHQSRRACAKPHPHQSRRRCRRARRQHFAYGFPRARARHSDGTRRTGCDPAHSRRVDRGCRWCCRRRALDGVMRARVYVTQPVGAAALARLRETAEVTLNPDALHIPTQVELLAAVRAHDVLFCLLHDRIDAAVINANPKLRMIASMTITPADIDVAAATARRLPVTVIPAALLNDATA